MKLHQAFHELLIPFLVEHFGYERYLEFGTGSNETIGKVKCPVRIGVDLHPIECAGVSHYAMSTQSFIFNHAQENAPYDFVFIDADHEHAQVLLDFYGIAAYVSERGLVALHDTNPASAGDTVPQASGTAWKAARDIFDSGRHESLTLPYSPGLTLVRKVGVWGPRA